MRYRPLNGRVLIKPDPPKTITKNGILIPEILQERPQLGTVVAVSPSTKKNPVYVEVGDRVQYGYSGSEPINIDGEDYLIMKQTNIYVKI
jgi:chaperonin GroES